MLRPRPSLRQGTGGASPFVVSNPFHGLSVVPCKLTPKVVKDIYGIVTVDNYVPMYKNIGEANIKEQLDKADNTINSIVQHINNKDEGTFNLDSEDNEVTEQEVEKTKTINSMRIIIWDFECCLAHV